MAISAPADAALSSINQYSLAGPTRVRAYESSQFSADNAIYTGVDWVLNAPDFFDWEIGNSNFKNIAQPFLFLEASWGETLSIAKNVDDITGQLLGAGIGLQISYSNVLQGNLQLAFPLDEDFSSDEIESAEIRRFITRLINQARPDLESITHAHQCIKTVRWWAIQREMDGLKQLMRDADARGEDFSEHLRRKVELQLEQRDIKPNPTPM